MKQLILKLSFLFCVFWLSGQANRLFSQVTIGSGLPPEKAALLEIKTKDATTALSPTDTTNITSELGGLGLPRVFLQNEFTLEPFIKTTDVIWKDSVTTKVKERHTGLVVYNIKVAKDTETDVKKKFVKGLYIWNGNRWCLIHEEPGRFFYMPSFNLKFTIGQVGNVEYLNLYEEYKKQFTNDANNLSFKSNNANIKTVPSPKNGRL